MCAEKVCGYPETPSETIADMFVLAQAIATLHRYKKGLTLTEADSVDLHAAADLFTLPESDSQTDRLDTQMRQLSFLAITDKLVPTMADEDPLNHLGRIKSVTGVVAASLRSVADGVELTPFGVEATDRMLTETLTILQSTDLSFQPQRPTTKSLIDAV